MDEELKDAGKRMDLSEEDVDRIKALKRKELIYIVLGGAAITVGSAIIGALAGGEDPIIDVHYSSYPYIGALALSTTFWQRNKKVLIMASIATIVVSVVAFVAAYVLSRPTYGIATDYGVYSDRRMT